MTKHAFIAGFVRSPFTFARKGALAGVRADDLGACHSHSTEPASLVRRSASWR